MLEALFNSGIDLTLYLQGLGEWAFAPMEAASFLGTEEFYLLLLPLLLWTVDSRLGVRVGVMLLVSGSLNNLAKWALHLPRPYWIAAEVHGLWAESGFGAPSGHAQLPSSIYGLIAAKIARGWVWAAALALIFLIGLSRMVLGVHFYFDVLLGWGLGFLTLWAFLRWEAPVKDWLARQSLGRQIGWVFAASAGILVVGALVLASSQDAQVPDVWIQNALADQPETAIEPFDFADLITTAATLFGLGAGAAWLASRGWFSARGKLWKRAVRFAVGIVGMLALWAGLGAVFPDEGDLLSYGLRFLRYGLVGFWAAGLAPETFVKLRLAERAD